MHEAGNGWGDRAGAPSLPVTDTPRLSRIRFPPLSGEANEENSCDNQTGADHATQGERLLRQPEHAELVEKRASTR